MSSCKELAQVDRPSAVSMPSQGHETMSLWLGMGIDQLNGFEGR